MRRTAALLSALLLTVPATAQTGTDSAANIKAHMAFLASDAASWITGQTLVMDGGQILGDATGFRGGLGG